MRAVVGFFAAVIAGSSAWGQNDSVSGTVTCLSRVALPPEATVKVTLEDVSSSQSPAKVIAELQFPTAGRQVPIPFELAYAPEDIILSHRYLIRAAISVADEVKFSSTSAYPVITHDAPSKVEIVVQPVRSTGAASRQRVPFEAPVTFFGDLPCADCAGIRSTLTLRPDGLFLMRRQYIDARGGENEVLHDLGRWSLEGRGTRLVLTSGKEPPEQYTVIESNTIRPLDKTGREIASTLNFSLTRANDVDPIADTFLMSGEIVYEGDTGYFTECLTGAKFPVAREKDHAALERAYAASGAVGLPLSVTLEGRLSSQPETEDGGQQEMIVVERFDRAWPIAGCPSRH
jgi:uncharacterized lipoprotein YbaY/uncharacterized lipoprotein NlpE involved in copper resistance